MDAWAKSVNTSGKVLMLADGSGQLTRAMGVELDLSDKGLGIRSRRYAMLLEDGVIKVLRLEEGGALTVSSADDILAAL
jgi:glutaredoxin-dependent peroxiredoxin